MNATDSTANHANVAPVPSVDYRDHFVLHLEAGRFDSIRDFTRALTTRQPGWLTRVSMGPSSAAASEAARDADPFERGSAVGNWQVIDRTDTSVTFGEDMGFMTYRMIYTWCSPDRVSARTEVMLTRRWFGGLYWAAARLMHRRFVPIMLRNAAVGRSRIDVVE